MAFTTLKYDKTWTSAEDFPTYQDDEEQVRADMQYHPDAVKDYINNTLLRELAARGAASELGAVYDGFASTVQAVLDNQKAALGQLRSDMESLAGGGTPDLVKSTPVNFLHDSWVTIADGVSFTILKSEHKRQNANFGFNLYQLVDGTYRTGTWGTASTRVTYNTDGSITLTADESYSGRIVFFGL